jgi:hypothetical protein
MSTVQLEKAIANGGEHLARALRETVRSVKSVNYGSVEVVIQNSRIVQIERKERFRFDQE